MTLEEQVEKLTKELENFKTEMAAKEQKIKELDTNISNQNSYITKLEQKTKEPKADPKPEPKPTPQNPMTNKQYEKYMMEKWKREVVQDGLQELRNKYPENHIRVLEDEVTDYCLKRMPENNTTKDYVVAAFQMLYGKALGDKDHLIHKARQGQTPPANPNPQKPVPNPLDTLNPPTMGDGDRNPLAGNVPPENKPTNVKESYKTLEARLANMGQDQ